MARNPRVRSRSMDRSYKTPPTRGRDPLIANEAGRAALRHPSCSDATGPQLTERTTSMQAGRSSAGSGAMIRCVRRRRGTRGCVRDQWIAPTKPAEPWERSIDRECGWQSGIAPPFLQRRYRPATDGTHDAYAGWPEQCRIGRHDSLRAATARNRRARSRSMDRSSKTPPTRRSDPLIANAHAGMALLAGRAPSRLPSPRHATDPRAP